MNIDNTTIKESITQRAMELWGVENKTNLDPIIDLLLDVFAYEFSKVNQSIKLSDARLLERISKILVQESWSLPMPAHGLLRAVPTVDTLTIDRNTQFYIQRPVRDGEYTDVFFTPLTSHTIINAQINCVAMHNNLFFKNELGRNSVVLNTKNGKQLPNYTLYVGIDIDKKVLQSLKSIDITLILSESLLDSYLKMIEVTDINNNTLEINTIEKAKNTNKEHYFETIEQYYQNYIYNIVLPESKTKKTLSQVFSDHFSSEELLENEIELFWLKLTFPVAFSEQELQKLEILLNTFPIVNRKIEYKQHNVKRNGKIISLRTLDEYFLNVEILEDNSGREYSTTSKKDVKDIKGSYSVFFGELEQFDERNAKAVLEEVIQKVREEGSSFSAIGYDLLNAYLEDLNEKLNILEHKVSIGYKNISDASNRQYLLTIPYDDTQNLECTYWVTDAEKANGIKKNSLLVQFQTMDISTKTIRLQTDIVGGNYKNSSKEKISNLRYGLLSKDRIVSKEDIKEFIIKTVGKTIKNVQVSSGVSISPYPKQGLIRTTNVEIEISRDINMSKENKLRLSAYLSSELQHKSVHNLPYQVIIK